MARSRSQIHGPRLRPEQQVPDLRLTLGSQPNGPPQPHQNRRTRASWLRPEALNPSRVRCTTLSRITRDPYTSRGTPKAARNTFSLAVKIDSSVCGTPAWARRSSPTRPTVTRSSLSRCKSSFRYRSSWAPCFHASRIASF